MENQLVGIIDLSDFRQNCLFCRAGFPSKMFQ